MDPSQESEPRAPQWAHRQSIALGILLGIFALCYAYELTNFNLSIDEEGLAFNPASWPISLGRWAQALVYGILWPEPTTPFGPFVLFGIFGSVGYLVLLRAFDVERPNIAHFAIFPIFIAYPVWFTQVEFSTNIIAQGAAVLACCAAVFFSKAMLLKIRGLNEGRALASTLYAVALCTVAIGVYQSFIFLYIALGIAISLYLHLRSTRPSLILYLANILAVVSIAAVSLVLDPIVAGLARWSYGVQSSAYVEHFIHLDRLLSDPLKVLGLTLRQIVHIYFSDWEPFGLARFVFVAILAFGAVALAISREAASSISRILVVLASLVVIAALPFCITLIAGEELPVRCFVAAPAVVWLFIFLPLELRPSARLIRCVVAISAIAFVQIIYIQSIVQARAWAVQRHDLLLASSIYNAVDQLDPPRAEGGAITVDFSGVAAPDSIYPQIPSATSGASFFEWDNGKCRRMVKFMYFSGLPDLKCANAEETEKLRPEFATMPSWPKFGSVKVVDGVALIKLSEAK
jgi:hypothetical protein